MCVCVCVYACTCVCLWLYLLNVFVTWCIGTSEFWLDHNEMLRRLNKSCCLHRNNHKISETSTPPPILVCVGTVRPIIQWLDPFAGKLFFSSVFYSHFHLLFSFFIWKRIIIANSVCMSLAYGGWLWPRSLFHPLWCQVSQFRKGTKVCESHWD